ncbi:MAG: prephenate dehydratase [Candidatus Hodarchaeaceae archaeon]|nr:prephenate dehydratase [Candidatus Hodarchaeaceae archaeon]
MKVAILGPRGTYAEIAARLRFGSSAEIAPYSMITDVAEAVARGEVDAGIIPVESLREGSVGEALDALAWTDIKVQAEIVVPISHCLIGVPGAKLENITQVLSHPQALAQCRDFLRKNLPKAELIEMTSTARAAEQVGKLKQPYMAAIGPRALADTYGLEVLRGNIQASEMNITRFLCLAKEDSRPTGHDKTSIVFYTAEDRPGILYEILREFAVRNINLTKIESRPSKRVLGDYLFFIDFEGHREDARVREALEALQTKVAMLKVVGSYPKRF